MKEKEKEIILNGLKLLKKTLFYCSFSKKILFCKKNYSWHFTILSKKKK